MPELIDHLETKHTRVTELGDIKRTLSSMIRNNGVRQALVVLTKQDHAFDQYAWRKWYIEARTPKEVNLRRRR
jgi:hypothetical protein